jgi:hypothetical protein
VGGEYGKLARTLQFVTMLNHRDLMNAGLGALSDLDARGGVR